MFIDQNMNSTFFSKNSIQFFMVFFLGYFEQFTKGRGGGQANPLKPLSILISQCSTCNTLHNKCIMSGMNWKETIYFISEKGKHVNKIEENHKGKDSRHKRSERCYCCLSGWVCGRGMWLNTLYDGGEKKSYPRTYRAKRCLLIVYICVNRFITINYQGNDTWNGLSIL